MAQRAQNDAPKWGSFRRSTEVSLAARLPPVRENPAKDTPKFAPSYSLGAEGATSEFRQDDLKVTVLVRLWTGAIL